MKIPAIVSDRIYVPLFSDLHDMYSELRLKFKHKDPDYYKKRSQGRWVGNMRPHIDNWANVVHPEYGDCLSIPRGGTETLRTIAYNFGYDISFVDNRFSLPPITGYENDVTLWPEQQQIAEIVFKTENCLIKSPTGSGKTEVLLKLAEWILRTAGPVLIIVWEGNRQSGLFKQWVDRIVLRFGIRKQDIGMLGDGVKRIAPLTIGMQQTLKNVGRRYIHSFGGVICDEVQRFAAPTFNKVVDIYPARYRIGASADETRNDGKEFLIYDVFGRVAGEVEKATLIDKGKIMPVTIRIVPTGFDLRYQLGSVDDDTCSWRDLPSIEKDYNELLDAMTTNEERNDLIWEFMEPCLEDNCTIIAATQRVGHSMKWDTRIQKAGYKSGLMIGGKDYADEFETTKNGLTTRKINAGVGTIQKVATGQDIPALDRVFVMTPLAQNKQLFEQMTGRLRRTTDGKDSAVLYYFWDEKLFPGVPKRLAKIYPGRTQVLVDGEFLDQ
jgi:superfamily II DNA or RNA helicase